MRKRILSLYILATLLAICESFAAPQSTVRLKGQLKNMGSKEVRMHYDGASSMLGDSRDIIIQTDAEGYFDIVINLSQPEYYSISRNTLYLTPGDDMTVKITTSNNEAEFSGKGAQANTYMKKRLFPKGGSFLEAGDNVKADFTATKKTIDSLATIRINELQTLDDVSKEFKILEKARIEADIINSYISYSWYSDLMKGAKSQQENKEIMAKFIQSITPELNKLYKQISADKFLDVAVVRDVMTYSVMPEYASLFEDVTIPGKTKELFAAYEKVRELQNKVNQATVDATVAFTQTLKNQDFANELNLKIAQIEKLLAGRPAPDLTLYTADGQPKKLSDFKGKNIYVDFWATWCGPCIQESPHFEKLSKKYEGKDIVFLPISTDTNKDAWLKYLKAHKKDLVQYGSLDRALKEDWAILYIPRFILIDKDFKIVDAYAPRPSSEEINGMIDALLQK